MLYILLYFDVIATVWFEVRSWDKISMMMSDWGKNTRLSFDNNYCVLVMLLACFNQISLSCLLKISTVLVAIKNNFRSISHA